MIAEIPTACAPPQVLGGYMSCPECGKIVNIILLLATVETMVQCPGCDIGAPLKCWKPAIVKTFDIWKTP